MTGRMRARSGRLGASTSSGVDTQDRTLHQQTLLSCGRTLFGASSEMEGNCL